METKEIWTNKAMQSLDGIGRVGLDTFQQEKILQNIQIPKPLNPTFRYTLVWKFAAIILLLVSLNIISILHFSGSNTTQNPVKNVASEYFSYINSYSF